MRSNDEGEVKGRIAREKWTDDLWLSSEFRIRMLPHENVTGVRIGVHETELESHRSENGSSDLLSLGTSAKVRGRRRTNVHPSSFVLRVPSFPAILCRSVYTLGRSCKRRGCISNPTHGCEVTTYSAVMTLAPVYSQTILGMKTEFLSCASSSTYANIFSEFLASCARSTSFLICSETYSPTKVTGRSKSCSKQYNNAL